MIFYCNVDVLERNIIISVVWWDQREDKNMKLNEPRSSPESTGESNQ